jgi:amino acid adenylation domain-containing protein
MRSSTICGAGVTAASGDGLTATPVVLQGRPVAERPLAAAQAPIWASQRLAPDVPLANMAEIHRIHGSLDPGLFETAFDLVVAASDALRTVVHDVPGRAPVQRVLPTPPARTELVDLDRTDVDAWCERRIAHPVDARRCGYDSALLRHGPDDWTWWIDLHHVITDASSSALVFHTTSAVYAALRDDDDLAVRAALDAIEPFGPHLDRIRPDDADVAGRRVILAGQVTGDGPITPYGPRGPRTTRVERRALPVPHDLDLAIGLHYRALSREAALLGLLATVLAATLHRLDGRSSFTFGVPVHHRSGPRAPRVIGPLMELYPLRVDVDADRSFAESFRAVVASMFGVLRHARPGESTDVAFDAIINVLTTSFGDFAGLPTRTSWARSAHVDPAHPLRVQAYDYGDGLQVELDLNDGLSTDGTHHRLPAHAGAMLAVAAEQPDASPADVDLLTDDEREVLRRLCPPAPDGPPLRPVHHLVSEALRRDPDHVTAEHDGRTMSAGELEARADDLARRLRADGVGRGARVGIRLRRSLDVLVAVHGVLRAGAAFVFLDPDDPPARHDLIADDAELRVILDELSSDPFEPHPTDTTEVTELDVGLDDLAYVLYTSGSTGAPKGVPISHRGLADYLRSAVASYRPDGELVMALHSSLVFDLTITSLFLPQLVGGRTVVLDGDPLSVLGRLAASDDVNVLKATPSQLELLARIADRPLPLQIVVVGGEAFRRPIAEAFAARCAAGVRIFNEYGPTEAVVGCMLHEWDPERDLGPDVPIGIADPGAEAYVLDPCGRPSAVGAWGELFVRRPGMASGYLNLARLSADRFAPVPTIDDRPLYRTGDRVRVEGDVVVYGGRNDDQLKVNGVRLEPGEIEAALVQHPDVTNAVVRVWQPGTTAGVRRCIRCGLGSDVPRVTIDAAGVCSVCHDFERIEPQTSAWFKSEADLADALADARTRASGDIDCLHLLSGGKDSTYALYQLVERGWRVHALTLDNGYIAEGAKENIRRTVADLGVSHEFVSTDAMAAIFRDSLERYSNVCNGCYKAIYTLAVARADQLGIPVVVTGLSRGQFFETRLLPHQFEVGRFDPAAIDRTVAEARRVYHHTTDAVTTMLPEQQVFERDDTDVLDRITFVDFFRYVDVELAEMYEFLEQRAPWVRPADTGRSTNCLINVAGIHVHRTERGYHNYAEPYSWDVRLGHKSRDEALDELDDEIDVDEVDRLLDEIGYRPKRVDVLTAWYQTADGRPIDAQLLRSHLRDLLPARSVPTAFVHVDELPLADSAKLDVGALPAPQRTHEGSARYDPPTTTTETIVAAVWAEVLEVERIGRTDDFFDLGGASLLALETVAALERELGIELPDALAFNHRIMHEFAAEIDAITGTAARSAPIPADDPALPPALAPGEEAMLLEYRGAPGDVRYNVTRLYTVPGEIDDRRLRAALRTVVERQAPLHTSFGQRRTRLRTDDALSVEPMPSIDPDAFAEAQRAVPFDLDHGPLVRVHVGRSGTEHTELLIAMHHLCVDAGTFDTFWDELDAAYHGRDLPPLRTTVSAHGRWQRGRWDADRAYWHRAGDRSERAGSVSLPVPANVGPDGYLERSTEIGAAELSASSVTTPFATALTAAAAVLAAHSRTGDVEIGITASTKDHPHAEPLVGYFLNTVPLLIATEPSTTLRDLERAVAGAVAEVLPYRTFPLAEIVRQARAAASPPPNVSYLLAYERLAPARWGDSFAEHRILWSGSAVGDLTFFVQERGDELRLGVEFRGREIGAETASSLLDAFATTLETLCRRPHRTVGSVRDEFATGDLAGVPVDPPARPLIADIVERLRERPDRVAVVGPGGSELDAATLLGRAERLASRIVAAVDRTGGTPRVGVALGRSERLIEAIVATHLAGCSYVPLDPASPDSRLALIIDAAAPDVVIVDPHRHVPTGEIPTIDIGSLDHADEPAAAPRSLPDLGDEAYLIFTSGSTGVPTGVSVSHANLAASTLARNHFYPTPPGRFLLTPSIGFDSSIVGLFWPLAVGGTIVLPADDDVHDVDRLAAVIADQDVTHLLMVPSLYRALLDRHPGRLRGLHTAIVAGEACPSPLVEAHHRALPDTELLNEYGPTEATVWAAAHRCMPGDDPVPIGRPIAGVTLRVADRWGRTLPDGSDGELLIAGPTVTGSEQTEQTEQTGRFTIVDGRRWYRTGDLVRRSPHGLVFAGRLDDQLNVAGVRLEPNEIESLLRELPGVTDAVVVAADLSGRPSLVAHLESDDTSIDADTVRAHLAHRVGGAAIPRQVAVHHALPRSPHGKIDRRLAAELPVAGADAGAGADDVRNSSDAVLAIWRSALRRSDLGDDADFFATGGDSLAAVEVVNALAELVGRDVPISLLLRAPTPATMAVELGVARPAVASSGSVQIVTMRPGLTGGDLVVLVAAWDDIHGYRALADACPDDVRVVGIAVVDDVDGTFDRVERVVEAAIGLVAEEVERARRVIIAGWSIGGVPAFELGQRLAVDGHRVVRIGLVDTFFPGQHRHLWSNRWWKYKSMLRPDGRIEATRQMRRAVRRRADRAAAIVGRRLLAFAGQTVPAVVTTTRTPGGIPFQAMEHEPTGGPVPVVLYSASTTNPARTEVPWRAVAPDLRVVRIPGRHRGPGSIMAVGKVERIAADLTDPDDPRPRRQGTSGGTSQAATWSKCPGVVG